MERTPVEMFVLAFLLSADKKRATDIWIRRDGDGSVVDFMIAGEWQQELAPPPGLHDAVVRQLSVMASLPAYGADEYAQGTIVLAVGTERTITFDIRVRGDGDSLEALLRCAAVSRP